MSRSLYARLHRRFGPKLSGAARGERQERHLLERAPNLPGPGFGQRPDGAPPPARPRAIVVGGGFGGMMAAATLCEHFEVVVLEARDRVGGRVWSLPGPGSRLIEGGAELIGYNHALWITLAREFGLGLSVLTDDDGAAAMGLKLPMRLGGRNLSPHQLEVVYDEMTKAFGVMGAEARAVNPYRPWTSENAQWLDNRPLSHWIADQQVSELTRAALETQFANNNGQPSANQSLLANLALVAGGAMSGDGGDIAFFTESETVRCQSGNQSLANMLAARVEWYGGKVLLNSPIEGVYSDGGTAIATLRGGQQVRGQVLVLATPPTTWPAVTPTPLPPGMQMGVGVVCKYLSNVDTRFWLYASLSPSSASDSYGMTWEGTDNQIGQPSEFSLFAGGPAAEAALARWRDGEAQLHQFYNTMIPEVYGGYHVNRQEWPRFMAWPYEPWTMTGYSCPSPGQVCTVSPQLATTWEGNIYFAGEHASPAFFGYMEGALDSGWRAALDILGRYDKPAP